MNNINNKFLQRNDIESLINKYINIYYDTLSIEDDPFKLNHILFPQPKREWFKINNLELIQRSFIHKSFWNTSNTFDETDAFSCFYLQKNFMGDYEKSELRGDKVIDLIILDFLMEKYPEKDQGQLTKLKSRLVRDDTLATISEHLGFKDYILFSSHIDRITNKKKESGRENRRFLEDIFESFIGNLYVDQNFNKDIIKPFLLGVYTKHIDLDHIINTEIDHKSNLLKFFHSQKFGAPKYTDLYFLGATTQRIFVSVILLETSKFFNEESNFSKNQEIINILTNKQNDYINYLYNGQLLQDIMNQHDQIKLESNGIKNMDPYSFLIDKLQNGYILLGISQSNTKKSAEQEASKDCLALFGQLK
jgi:dsRNA-specific ribonuclease